jgi:hypothetical protein
MSERRPAPHNASVTVVLISRCRFAAAQYVFEVSD